MIRLEKAGNICYEAFEEFVNTFCSMNERKVIRCKATSGKMIKWFEEKIS